MPQQSDHTTRTASTRHACHCGKEFIRKEHLRRHQATHGERAHVCPVCQRSFTRGDLLRRHVSRHDSSAESQTSRRLRACDACHANKTKCTGGPRCSLCAKRGVCCTFKGDRSDDAAAAEPGPAASNRRGPNEDSSLISVASTNSFQLVGQEQTVPKSLLSLHPESFNFLLGLTVQPTKSKPELLDSYINNRTRNQPACNYRTGMEAVYQAIVSKSESLLNPAQGASDKIQAWIACCTKAYFQQVHPHWPIFHAPTFTVDGPPPCAVHATVVMLAILSGPQNPEIESLADIIYACHQILVSRFIEELSRPELSARDGPWPMNFYRSVLLTIIFAIYTNRAAEMTRASLLLSLFFTHLRQNNVFSAEAAEIQRQKYHTGTFLPMVLAVRETRKRLLTCLFKADAYLALFNGQAPNMHNEELDFGLPQTHAFWNSYDLSVFYKRYPNEPSGREDQKFALLAPNSGARLGSVLLAEDIELGLCRMAECVWRYSQICKASGPMDIDPTPPAPLLEELEAWKSQLTKLSNLLKAQSLDISAPWRYPLDAYRDNDDDLPQREWMEGALRRALTLVQDAMLLYHVLNLCLLLDPRTPNFRQLQQYPAQAATDPSGQERLFPANGGVQSTQLSSSSSSFDWLMSANGRHASSHTLAIMAMAENFAGREARALRPIQGLAVAVAGHVLHLGSGHMHGSGSVGIV